MMASLNVRNRTLFTGDNLDVGRGMHSECVDLIYLDPPFNSNRNSEAPRRPGPGGRMLGHPALWMLRGSG